MGHIVGEVVWYVYDMARLHQMCDWRQVLLWGAVRGNITHSGQIHVVWLIYGILIHRRQYELCSLERS